MGFPNYQTAAVAMRRYINDIPQLNTLDKDFESTDDELAEFIRETLMDINMSYEPTTGWDIGDIRINATDSGALSWGTVKMGAILHLLTAKGIWSARNAITYSDAGGVTVAEMDRYGRYQIYAQRIQPEFDRMVRMAKMRLNIQQGYGGVNSPFGFDFYYG
jgi:hypothetical protein